MVDILIANLSDAEALIELQCLAYQSEAKLYNDWSLPALTQTVESLRQEFANSTILKALIEGQIVGSIRATAENKVCKIGRLIVHPDFQKRGIGSTLLAHLESLYADAAYFELFTGSKSVSNIRLYERHGYRITETKPLSDKVSLTFLVKKPKEGMLTNP
ncbi:MAG: GNAT family N-acetyltransferase [Thiothrix sp.]|nr:MAG: GNAT family N-acetyltransferase [Thiothrix sp.]